MPSTNVALTAEAWTVVQAGAGSFHVGVTAPAQWLVNPTASPPAASLVGIEFGESRSFDLLATETLYIRTRQGGTAIVVPA